MLTDYWVMAQVLGLCCSALLMTVAVWQAVGFLRHWEAGSSTALQLALERRTYLVSAIVKVVLSFQVLLLLLFLYTANHHLPPMLKGAMCAEGVLSAHAWGKPLLWLKVAGILVYTPFWVLHRTDDRFPDYPLTPAKYYWIFPAWLCMGADLCLTVGYFGGLSPDIITTCCSVAFSPVAGGHVHQAWWEQSGPWWPWLLAATWALLMLGQRLRTGIWLVLPLNVLFVAMAALSLRLFFVKYIYGLPSHLCAYDTFLGQYHGIGYLLFGSMLTVLGATIVQVLGRFYAVNTEDLQASRRVIWLAASLATWIPMWYWWAWTGEM